MKNAIYNYSHPHKCFCLISKKVFLIFHFYLFFDSFLHICNVCWSYPPQLPTVTVSNSLQAVLILHVSPWLNQLVLAADWWILLAWSCVGLVRVTTAVWLMSAADMFWQGGRISQHSPVLTACGPPLAAYRLVGFYRASPFIPSFGCSTPDSVSPDLCFHR